MTEAARDLVLVNNPRASSGLGGYIADALSHNGCSVTRISPMGSRWRKLLPVLRSLRFNRDAMWKARWENLVFSPAAWDRTSRYVGRQLEENGLLEKPILVVGKEYYPHPGYRDLNYAVFIHHNLRLALADGVTPWLPAAKHVDAFLERETNLYRYARHVFVGAQYVADSLVNDYGVDAGNISIAGGGPQPYFESHYAEEVPSSFSNRVLFVGWDFGMKGGADLLRAFKIVHDRRPETRLLIAGPDESQWVDQPGVEWLGQVRSKDALTALYRGSDLFVMPSLRDSFGFVFLEAMTQGVPCIGTNINAMPEMIPEGVCGYTVPVRDPDRLAEAILGYYGDEANRRRMGDAAMRHVRDRYTWKYVVECIRGRWL